MAGEERETAPLEARLAAARECVRAGFRVCLHFDPICLFPGWERGYAATVDMPRVLIVDDSRYQRHLITQALGGTFVSDQAADGREAVTLFAAALAAGTRYDLVVMAAKAAALRRQGRTVLDLSAGEPDFPTPEHIKAAAKIAIDQNWTRYTPVPGLTDLREAVAAFFGKTYGVTVPAEAVIATNGGKQALYNLFLATLNVGEEVLVPAPYWVSYPDMLRLAGAVPVPVPSSPERGFLLTPAELDRAVTPATRALILNSPCNPTGAQYTAEALAAIMAVVDLLEVIHVEHQAAAGPFGPLGRFQQLGAAVEKKPAVIKPRQRVLDA